MRILYYNWVDYLDPEKRGGGVSVYQKNLIHSLAGGDGQDVSFIASGIAYDLSHKAPHVREIKADGPVRRFELVNSEVLSPGHLSFHSEASVQAPATTAAFRDFLDREGPFDVIHFNNLEGLPAEVLALKRHYPNTRFIYSLHNYFAVCPQVNLWFQERENCTDYDGGRKCATCLMFEPNSGGARKANALASMLKRLGIMPGTRLFNLAFRYAPGVYRLGKRLLARIKGERDADTSADNGSGLIRLVPESPPRSAYFAHRRERFCQYINEYCDQVLAVSERVKEVAARFGIDERLITTSYIGTRVAEEYQAPDTEALARRLAGRDHISLGYLGYMRRDKGFYFLLEALEAFPAELAARVKLVIAARFADPAAWQRLNLLAEKFKSIDYADGYNHDTLDDLYERIDLAVVPVLWEDNLPQVAIEALCHQVPVLASNLGGAQELGGKNPDFVFRAGDADAFINRVTRFVEHPGRLVDFWGHASAPVTMDEHLDQLRALYAGRETVSTAQREAV
ncbi:glycosyltransferase [Alloalcanivorax sp. C16-2]|uniref:glycosyltransferase n=1 Tax=Alloalcanivorax TaxID=3020832 RepID=UPI0019318434|nr:glycosyltransferase [Alloalcanivorax marinus]MBL7250154.1 glycosyltransferase [Alloalcanivorax marinus]